MSKKGGNKLEPAQHEVSSVAIVPTLPFYRRPVDQDGFWDCQEKEDRLRTLFAQGLSKAQIQKELGAPSRNVVIGKIRRLGLRRAGDDQNGEPVPKRPVRHQVKRAAGSSVKGVRLGKATFRPLDFRRVELEGFVGTVVGVDGYVPRAAPDVPVAQRKTFMEVLNQHCRWPFGDPCEPGFYFCGDPGADLIGGRAYCCEHTVLSKPASNGGK